MAVKISNVFFILDILIDNKRLTKKILMLYLNDLRLSEHVNWYRTYELGIKLGLLKESKGYSSATNIGENFHSMNIHKQHLSDQQKKLVFTKCVLKNENFLNINLFLDLFSSNEKGDFELFKTVTALDKTNLMLDEKLLLLELGVYQITSKKYLINKKHSEKMNQSRIFNSNEMTDSELDEILEEQKRIGNMAEDLTFKFEKNEFNKKNWSYQANNVKLISKKNVGAGYDVESFLTKNSKLNKLGSGDKHIEVKGRKWKEFSFIISANELKIGNLISKKKNEQYLVYFWNNLGSKNPPIVPTKIIPFKDLKIELCKNCLKYLVHLE